MARTKERWIMFISNQQYGDDESESSLNSLVDFSSEKNGDIVIRYDESETTGMDGTTTEIRVSPDDLVVVNRTGNFRSHLVIESGRQNYCVYETPFGSMEVCIRGMWVKNTLTKNGGSLSMRYLVYGGNATISDTLVELTVSKEKHSDKGEAKS